MRNLNTMFRKKIIGKDYLSDSLIFADSSIVSDPVNYPGKHHMQPDIYPITLVEHLPANCIIQLYLSAFLSTVVIRLLLVWI
jgi:hypothetical protein